MESLEDWITSEEACARLGIAWRTLYNLHRRSPDFPTPRKIGRTLLWPRAELDAWRAEHPTRKR
ncbi:helix-turn-helix domain-containing protein [Streptomyces sp. CC208A]|uniref:helix-turn-helix transcriptional regulator n=1 Tax=Streptomyces sp. CC208A TaxID=3044573 RepID=UPI0024A9D7A4|nr:helix-turn-helix domain-containing protein [Streptomyces sp. CC208A]